MFEYNEDYKFFVDKLSSGDSRLFSIKLDKLFDFRDPAIKRKEFDRIKSRLYKELVLKHGKKCQLEISPNCSKQGKFEIDHFIPLSTNELNKKLRHMNAEKGKKVPSQSFGSNDISNLRIACKECNALKKHRLIF